ncbi:MAG: hypothetical protein LQ350_000364 [Teloschistes chrysophthalmus]|nr:MAG: hypothetical protein LQ350_000364 [Niorma chrysophthalma]
MEDSEQKLPLHEDIMQLARLGEIGPIQKLLDEGKFKADYRDAENTTPLHWAAINNHYALCEYLLKQGADVNATGGESEATPAQWAVQRCHYYTVSLLLRYGADPNIADGQGYKMIHLATFDGNAFMLLIILLHPQVSVDEPDAQGHTALMWAAYNRLPSIVELLLRFGASAHAVDETGFAPLHWALVRGSPPCILKLLQNGADRFAATWTGKTPAVVADEMKTSRAWHRALDESGYQDDATVKQLPIPYISFIKNRSFLNKFFFLVPFPVLLVVFTILSRMVIYAAIPIACFCAYCLQWVAQQVLLWAPSDMKHLHKTLSMTINNHRHFYLYVCSGVIGILLFVRLSLSYLQTLPPPPSRECNLLSPELCDIVLRDPFIVVLAIWCILQLMWMCMLFIVQSVQIARAITTYESMSSHLKHASPASQAITSALTAGTTSLDAASLTTSGAGPNPAIPTSSSTPPTSGPPPHNNQTPAQQHPRREGFFTQWKKLLGLDTFVAIAFGGTAAAASGRRQRRKNNVFSRGVVTNCRDFWCDPAPVFGRRGNGDAMLGGEVVNYTRMYESPGRMRMGMVGRERGAYRRLGDGEGEGEDV